MGLVAFPMGRLALPIAVVRDPAASARQNTAVPVAFPTVGADADLLAVKRIT
jgi:hypothetical protein